MLYALHFNITNCNSFSISFCKERMIAFLSLIPDAMVILPAFVVALQAHDFFDEISLPGLLRFKLLQYVVHKPADMLF